MVLGLYLVLFALLRLPYQAVGIGCTLASIVLLAPPFVRRHNSLLFRALLGLPFYVPMLYIAVTTLSISDMVTFTVVGLLLLIGSLMLLRDGCVQVSVRDISIHRPLRRRTISLDEIAAVEPAPLRRGLLRLLGFGGPTTLLRLESWSSQRRMGRRRTRVSLSLDPGQREGFIAEVESLLMAGPFEDSLLI